MRGAPKTIFINNQTSLTCKSNIYKDGEWYSAWGLIRKTGPWQSHPWSKHFRSLRLFRPGFGWITRLPRSSFHKAEKSVGIMRLITGKSLSVLAFALSASQCHSCAALYELVLLYFSSVHRSYKYSIKYVELLKEKPTWTVRQILSGI